MKKLSPHFWYSKSQRNGVIFLLLIILILQGFISFHPKENQLTSIVGPDISKYKRQLDSLSELKSIKQKVEIFPFNPNFISDYKGYQLGLSVEEIDRIHSFRKKGKFVNSAAEFQSVTGVSDSLLKEIAPFFKFPKWVEHKKEQLKKTGNPNKTAITKRDINKATQEDLKSINGIGEKLSQQILNYRKRIQGFYFKDQMNEVWGLEETLIDKIWEYFEISEKPKINKININTASFKEVLAIPYIDYKLCKRIFEYRDLNAEFQNLTELQRIDSFPKNKYDRIVLYLSAE